MIWPITGLKEGMGLDVIDSDNNNEKEDSNSIISLLAGKVTRTNPQKISPTKIVIIRTFLDSIPENIYIGIIIALSLPGLTPAVIYYSWETWRLH